MAALKSQNLPMNPAVGGIPPSDSMNSSMANAANGWRACSPLKSLSSSPATSVRRIITITAKAPICMNE